METKAHFSLLIVLDTCNSFRALVQETFETSSQGEQLTALQIELLGPKLKGKKKPKERANQIESKGQTGMRL